MIEISTALFTLITEGFIALLIALSVTGFIFYKRKGKDRAAAVKLVDQIKQQSKTRLEQTGSFLNEKYRFEGNDLEKAVKSIDKAEKKFMQIMINVYLQRDAQGLVSMDASVAEMIEAYKELSPVMPDAEMLAEMASGTPEQAEELEQLREANEKLTEELSITKETMSNMIAEFGNMFGGGKEHELENKEVVGKLNEPNDEVEDVISESPSGQDDIEVNDPVDNEIQVDDSKSEKIPEEDNSVLG